MMLTALLTWITEANFDRRIEMCRQTSRTWTDFDGELVVINNGGLGDVVRDLYPNRTVIDLSRNYFDVAVHHVGYCLAKLRNRPYFAYTYDDFLLTNSRGLISHPTTYMTLSPDVSCCRLAAYEFDDPSYNTAHTPKDVNPDSVRHETGAGDLALTFSKPFSVGTMGSNFYTTFKDTNWRPNSRPTVWDTTKFEKFAIDGQCPVMQPFEAHMYAVADELARQGKWQSAASAPGFFKTFPVGTSERTRSPNHFRDVSVDTSELMKEVTAWNSRGSLSGR